MRSQGGRFLGIALFWAALILVGCSSSSDPASDFDGEDSGYDAIVFDMGSDFADVDLAEDLDSGPDSDVWPEMQGCNTHEELCARTLPEVSLATTHNAMSSEEDGWVSPNQYWGVKRQLADGIRGFMIDIHEEDGEILLCHGLCLAGSVSLSDWLRELTLFLEARPNNVLVLILENYVSADDLEVSFTEAGLSEHLYVHSGNWPPLQQMIDMGKQVVVMSDVEGGERPWIHPIWSLAWETHWANEVKEDFTCDKNRGTVTNDLFIMNHFLTRPLANPNYAEEVNHNPYLLERARQCEAAFGHIPNFLSVDFYSIGDVLGVVDSLNRVEP